MIYRILNTPRIIALLQFSPSHEFNAHFIVLSITISFHIHIFPCLHLYLYLYLVKFEIFFEIFQNWGIWKNIFSSMALRHWKRGIICLHIQTFLWYLELQTLVWYSEFHIGGYPTIFSQICFTNVKLQYCFLQNTWPQSFVSNIESVYLFAVSILISVPFFCSASYFIGKKRFPIFFSTYLASYWVRVVRRIFSYYFPHDNWCLSELFHTPYFVRFCTFKT